MIYKLYTYFTYPNADPFYLILRKIKSKCQLQNRISVQSKSFEFEIRTHFLLCIFFIFCVLLRFFLYVFLGTMHSVNCHLVSVAIRNKLFDYIIPVRLMCLLHRNKMFRTIVKAKTKV